MALALNSCNALASSSLERRETETLRHLVILYTNDEHGWMEPYQNTGGAAGMLRLWKYRERLGANDHLLVLSGGDMWTGPALSTELQGESMADVMNQMGYSAAAIGNHDFDFGQDAIRTRLAQSEFPFLSANIRDVVTGDIPEYVQPYLITEVNGVKVGIIGLTTTEAKVDTKPAFVANLRFLEYREVIPTFAAQARADGAELLMIIAHVCIGETRELAQLAAENGISIIGGGHCHEEHNEVKNEVRLVESGYFMRGYIRLELLFDIETDRIVDEHSELIRNPAWRGDPQVLQLMEQWQARADPALWEPIGYADRSIDRESAQMAELLLMPWLEAWPEADVALADPRYVQQDLYPGPITAATVEGILSTTNQLVEVELSGAELIEVIESRHPLVAGVERLGDQLLIAGSPVELSAVYRVLVSDSLYAGGNGYSIAAFDRSPVFTGIDWRLPAVEWIASIGSGPADPIALSLPN